MKRLVFISNLFIVCCFSFSSCATVLNTKYTEIKVITDRPAVTVIDSDTSKMIKRRSVRVKRSPNPLEIVADDGTLSKRVLIKSVNSDAYIYNYLSILLIPAGLLIDRHSDKRYGYPSPIKIEVDFSNASVEIGYERAFSKRFSTVLTSSPLLSGPLFYQLHDIPARVKGFRLSAEEKLYPKSQAPYGKYFALELSYLKTDFNTTGSFRSPDDTGTMGTHPLTGYRDTFNIHRNTFTGSFKIGYQEIKGRFTFDFFVGLGIRFRSVQHFNRKNPDDVMYNPAIDFNLGTYIDGPGKTVGMHVPLNIRIGYLF